jgi:hypothetical protein
VIAGPGNVAAAFVGIALIVSGVVVINLFSAATVH